MRLQTVVDQKTSETTAELEYVVAVVLDGLYVYSDTFAELHCVAGFERLEEVHAAYLTLLRLRATRSDVIR